MFLPDPCATLAGSMRGTASGLLPLMKSHSAWSESSFTSSAAGAAGGAAGSGGADGWGVGGANDAGGGGNQQPQEAPDSPRRSGDISRVTTPEFRWGLYWSCSNRPYVVMQQTQGRYRKGDYFKARVCLISSRGGGVEWQ